LPNPTPTITPKEPVANELPEWAVRSRAAVGASTETPSATPQASTPLPLPDWAVKSRAALGLPTATPGPGKRP
jgi:hypothetical protein